MTTKGYWDGFNGEPKMPLNIDLLYEVEYNRGVSDRFCLEQNKAKKERIEFEKWCKEQEELQRKIEFEKMRREEDIKIQVQLDRKRQEDEDLRLKIKKENEVCDIIKRKNESQPLNPNFSYEKLKI